MRLPLDEPLAISADAPIDIRLCDFKKAAKQLTSVVILGPVREASAVPPQLHIYDYSSVLGISATLTADIGGNSLPFRINAPSVSDTEPTGW